ncbi:DUF2911 domain-containing protein [Emticicia sp. TH156]|uniref:DUF2911 domain-containing protein n=1 Tax=Emticicia sp. TH156 TaxID=2067454 RepID=UPI000C77A5A2|nr:DUF2911 domain-containing protein [Emticicia sp. TH156]PLK42535.1 hypothetical protein C0V77_20115 [Emticicia sp. TH156]
MNKKIGILLAGVAVLALAFFGVRAYTKSKSPADTASFNQNGLSVQVDYCRPYKKDRVVFGQLVPYGKVWRTGANEATLFTVKQDVKIAGKPLKAGTYTLWTVPNADVWTIVLNRQTGQWGTKYDELQDVLRVDVPAGKTTGTVEQFKIDFAAMAGGANMVLLWENSEVKVPVTL